MSSKAATIEVQHANFDSKGLESMQRGTLHFISGRLAAGKTTLARELAADHHAVLISEDVWLSKLSDGISSFDDYLKWSRRCRSVMGPLIVDMLRAGVCVVLDFAGNTIAERAWARNLSDGARSPHMLHFLDVGEEECLHRLMARNERKPEGLYFASTTETEFRAICKWFQVPTSEEGLIITTHS
jgi:predicted kinase